MEFFHPDPIKKYPNKERLIKNIMENKMRDLLLSLLKDQKRLTGIRQYEEIASNPNGKEAAQIELDALLKEMVEVCNQYSYISDEDKFKIIKARMTDAPEYYGLNARFVRLALERVKDIYWRESGHLETNAILAEPIKTVPPPPEFIEATLKLAQDQSKIIPSVSPVELEKAKERPKEVANSIGIPYGTKEYYEMKELKRQWMIANTDKQTGKITGIEFNQWLESKHPQK